MLDDVNMLNKMKQVIVKNFFIFFFIRTVDTLTSVVLEIHLSGNNNQTLENCTNKKVLQKREDILIILMKFVLEFKMI